MPHSFASGPAPGLLPASARRSSARSARTGTSSSAIPWLQTKLTISTPGDRFEREADQVADRVMRAPTPAAPAFTSSERSVQRACASCDEPEKLQRAAAPGVTAAAASRSASAGAGAPPIVRDVLRQPGAPLDAPTRAFMEPRFGRDLGHVRVHTGTRAAASAHAVGALAYTVGSDIVFARGTFAPGTSSGQRLLAHELVHTFQQTGGVATLRDDAPDIGRASAPMLARYDCSKLKYRDCITGVYKCGYGNSGTCGWVGPTRGGCICVGAARPPLTRVLEVLAIVGLSVALLATVLAALADPEPASKLALAGLSAAQITLLLSMLGYGGSGSGSGGA